nr:aminoglycoside phosphotransferase family protein [Kitasatospora purpeofusca]
MTTKPFPSELRDWVAGHLPGLDGSEDRSWPRSSSRVWRVTAGARTAYVKIGPGELDYEREVAGYAYTAAHLSDREAPRLLATDPQLRAILSSVLPGRVVRDLPLGADVELRLYEDAGRLLRSWHDASGPGTDVDRAAVRAGMREQAREAADCLGSTAPHLRRPARAGRGRVGGTGRPRRGVAVGLPPRRLRDPELAVRRGDRPPRSDRLRDGRVGRGRGGVVWLFGAVWPLRPELREAYFVGYGRPLTAEEERLLKLLTVRRAVSYLHHGLVDGREDLVARGRLVLDRMVAHRRWSNGARG